MLVKCLFVAVWMLPELFSPPTRRCMGAGAGAGAGPPARWAPATASATIVTAKGVLILQQEKHGKCTVKKGLALKK